MSRCPSASWPSRSRGERGQVGHPAGAVSIGFWENSGEFIRNHADVHAEYDIIQFTAAISNHNIIITLLRSTQDLPRAELLKSVQLRSHHNKILLLVPSFGPGRKSARPSQKRHSNNYDNCTKVLRKLFSFNM